MHPGSILLLLAGLVAVASTQPTQPPCAFAYVGSVPHASLVCDGTSCFGCLIENGCGWCAPTQTCHSGDFSGPNDGSVCLTNWFANLPGLPPSTEQCPVPSCVQCTHTPGCGWCGRCVEVTATPVANCSFFETCHYTQCYSCLAQEGCTYCSKTMRCDVGGTSSCNGGPQLTTCGCNQFRECNTCTTQETCAWCASQGTCQDADLSSSCMQTHLCPSSKASFPAGAFIGGMFLTVGVLVLMIGVYFIWTLWATKRSRYVEVQ